MSYPRDLSRQSRAGRPTLWIPAGAIQPALTNGASMNVVETTTNKTVLRTLDFSSTVNQYGQFTLALPFNWSIDSLVPSVVWSHASGSGTVIWAIQAVSISPGESMDSTYGTAISLSSTSTGAGFMNRVDGVTAVTPGGSVNAGDSIIFQVYRNAVNASDTLEGVNARLHGIYLTYTA